jgi:hypothetical protein
MKPAWDKLSKLYADSKTAGIYDVDCTTEGKDLCETHGVQGFPTIKYGDPSALEDYEGGRDFDALKTFAEENLKPMCSPSNIDLCEADKKKQIEELMAMSADALDAKIAEKEKEQKDAEAHFEAEVKKLQETYEGLSKTKDETLKAIKESGLGMMKAVMAASKKKEEL